MMNSYSNMFKPKSEKELRLLYEQFLAYEKTGVVPSGTEFANIRDKYCEWFSSNPLAMVQYDLLHAISDLWYESLEKQETMERYEKCGIK